MYKLIHFISAIIRQLFLPNPYSNIINNPSYADVFNIFIGGAILGLLAYLLTGCGYTKKVDSPAFGSFGYLISYIYLTFLITGLGYVISNVVWVIVLFLIIYLISCIVVFCIFKKDRLLYKY